MVLNITQANHLTDKFNAYGYQNIPLKFQTQVTRIERASPLSDTCSDVVVQLCPHLNYPIIQLVDIRYVCLVHLLLHDTAERLVNRI